MIPNDLDGWTLERLRLLVDQGVFETDRFDFKGLLPPSKDVVGKSRLRRDIAAFANSAGGFLVYGVKDDKGLTTDQRLVGVVATQDFPEHFGNYPAAAEPSIEWTFKNPPLALPSGNVIHIVSIPPSSMRPHGVFEDERWWFPKRTNKGTEALTHTELRDAFGATREKVAKLRLMLAEVDAVRSTAHVVNVRAYQAGAWQGSIPSYDDSLIRSLLPDVAPLIHHDVQLMQYLPLLREAIREAEEMRTAPWVVHANRTGAKLVAHNLGRAAQAILQAVDRLRPHLEGAVTRAR